MPTRLFIDGEASCHPWEGAPELVWLGLTNDAGESLLLVNEAHREAMRGADADTDLSGVVWVEPADAHQVIADWCDDSIDEIWSWCPHPQQLVDAGADGTVEEVYERYGDPAFAILRSVVPRWPEDWPEGAIDLQAAMARHPIKLDWPSTEPSRPDGGAEWVAANWRKIRESDFPGGQVEVLVFLIPLPQPLPVPHGWQIRAMEDETFERRRRFGGLANLTASLCFTHAELDRHPVTMEVAALFDLAYRSRGETGSDAPDPLEPQLTVVESFVPYDEEVDPSDCFDEALRQIRHVQRAYAAVEQREVLLVSHGTLPPIVPMWHGTIPDWGLQPEPGPLVPFFLGPTRLTPSDGLGDLTDEKLDRLAPMSRQLTEATTLGNYTDLRREAMTQLRVHGNWRLAALTVAIAGEIMLDTILLHLHWEEGTEIQDAARLFMLSERASHVWRVKSCFAELLGGSWSLEAPGPVRDYHQNVALIRHRIAHSGYDPSHAEAEAALNTLLDLERFVGDRLTHSDNLNVYTRTARAWCGNNGLAERGRLTRRVRELIADPSEPPWSDTFERYRQHVDFIASGHRPVPGEDGNDIHVVALYWPDSGHRRILLHDLTACAAVIVDVDAVDVDLDRYDFGDLASPEHVAPVRTRIFDASTKRPRGDWVWVDDYEIVPSRRIHLGALRSVLPPLYRRPDDE